jgi:predicted Rossmann-fold nucleotide-binding protein
MKGFWNKLIETLDKLETDGFIRGNWHEYILVADSLEDIKRFASETIE